jgi:hypothetical protein
MSPIVQIVGAEEPNEVFVSIEAVPLVLSELRRSLPELARELKKRWPVDGVRLDARRPRLRNPLDPTTQHLVHAAIGIFILYGSRFGHQTITKISDRVSDEIADYVSKWLKRKFAKPKSKLKPKRRKT